MRPAVKCRLVTLAAAFCAGLIILVLLSHPGQDKQMPIVATPTAPSVTVCGFEFVFRDREEAAVYLKWFENYAKQHRRQFDDLRRHTVVLANRLVKLPAHLFNLHTCA